MASSAANGVSLDSVAAGAPTPRRKGCGSIDVKATKAFLLQHHLPIGLFVMTLFGFLVPWPGLAMPASWNTISICGIFFITGLGLQTAEMKKALRESWSAIRWAAMILLLLRSGARRGPATLNSAFLWRC